MLFRSLGPKGVQCFSVNPGLILETNLQDHLTREMFADGVKIAHDIEKNEGRKLTPSATRPKPLAAGTATSIYGSLAPELEKDNGALLDDVDVLEKKWMYAHVLGEEHQAKLWALSDKLAGEKFDW